jgi:predicted molibdopterin-dependent oxidoreductase YjgC
VTIEVDGSAVGVYRGETVATALLASGRRAFRRTATGSPRGPFCNMGICFDCVVVAAGLGRVRACLTPIEPGMVIRTDAFERETD